MILQTRENWKEPLLYHKHGHHGVSIFLEFYLSVVTNHIIDLQEDDSNYAFEIFQAETLLSRNSQ